MHVQRVMVDKEGEVNQGSVLGLCREAGCVVLVSEPVVMLVAHLLDGSELHGGTKSEALELISP